MENQISFNCFLEDFLGLKHISIKAKKTDISNTETKWEMQWISHFSSKIIFVNLGRMGLSDLYCKNQDNHQLTAKNYNIFSLPISDHLDLCIPDLVALNKNQRHPHILQFLGDHRPIRFTGYKKQTKSDTLFLNQKLF